MNEQKKGREMKDDEGKRFGEQIRNVVGDAMRDASGEEGYWNEDGYWVWGSNLRAQKKALVEALRGAAADIEGVEARDWPFEEDADKFFYLETEDHKRFSVHVEEFDRFQAGKCTSSRYQLVTPGRGPTGLRPFSWTSSYPYSPEWVEEEFPEVHLQHPG